MKFACFSCRKVFNKLTGKIEADVVSRHSEWTPPFYQCSECGSQLYFTGEEFRPPTRQALDQWRKAELLIRNGLLFHKDIGPYPKTLSEARKLINNRKRFKDVSEAMQTAKYRKIHNRTSAEKSAS